MTGTTDTNWAAHNTEVADVWMSYRDGRPKRPPVIFDLPAIYTLSHPEINPTGMGFDEYILDPDKQIKHQLQAQRWLRYQPRRDSLMGPDSGPLQLIVDDQNFYEASWLGCPVEFRPSQPPYAAPLLAEHPEKLYDLSFPDPCGGMMARSLEYFEFMHEWAEGAEYDGFTVAPPTRIKGLGSDGIFTLACEMRGAVNVCTDIYENPRYVHDLLDYIADSVISRIRGLRSYFGRKWPELGQHVTPRNWGFGDDSIQLISTSTLKEFVLPRQKRLLHALAGDGPHSLHLCGDAMRHLPTLVTELNMGSFDTGFPMNFDWVRENVGANIEIVGGPDVMGIHAGPRESIVEETRRILVDTSIRQGGRFIAREANSVVPGTPIENVETVYDAVRRFGVYAEGEWDSSATPPNSASVAVAQPAFSGIGAALVGMEEAGSDR